MPTVNLIYNFVQTFYSFQYSIVTQIVQGRHSSTSKCAVQQLRQIRWQCSALCYSIVPRTLPPSLSSLASSLDT